MSDKRILFVATIGNRDVQLDGAELRPARVEGEKALSIANSEPKRFSLPILLPALKAIKQPIERLILIVTDQPEEVGSKHRSSDTLHFGKIIKILLGQQYKRLGFADKPAEKIEIISISENPTVLSGLLRELQKTLTNKFLQWSKSGHKELALCITGGIPTLNSAVMLLASRVFKSGLKLYRVNDNGLAFPDPVADEFEKQDLRSIIQELAGSWSFKSIAMRIEERALDEEPFNQIRVLCQAMSCRLVFDFAGALEILSENFARAGRFMPVFECLLNELALLNRLDSVENARVLLIRELLFNLMFKFRQHEYVDVAGRLFRLLEECAILLLEKLTGKILPFSEDERGYPAFTAFVESNQPLLDHLSSKKIDYRRLNQYTAEHTLQFMIENEDVQEMLRSKILEFLYCYKKLERIKQLRNKSIIAHGFKSIRYEDFPDDFIDLMKKLAALIGIDNFENPAEMLLSKINESI